jgi:fibronectin type 3 domain-containing protein
VRYKTGLTTTFALAAAVLIFAWTRPQITAFTTPHSVIITWNAVATAKSYNIYRSAVGGSQYKKIGNSPTNSYTDSPVASKSVFYYVVTAVNGQGESKYSEEVKAIVP